MKKFIFSAVAAGALAVGGAASAQDVGDVLTNILGSFGVPVYGTQQQQSGSVYVDQYGRQVMIDQYGRHVLVQPNTVYGNTVYGNTVYDAYGRPVYTTPNGSYAYANPRDRDGDGVRNRLDRWPDDPRYR
jgi:hypothetical protein